MMKAAIIEKELSCAEYLKLLLLKWADKKTDLNISVFLNGDDFFHGKNSDILEFDIVFIELKLNKNFREQKKTVEAMQGACSYYGKCACSAVLDCGCNNARPNQQYSQYTIQGNQYFNSFSGAAN